MDQQQCAHDRVITYSFIEEDFVRRVCADCGMPLSPAAADPSADGAAQLLVVPAGSVIKINGFPFKLMADASVEGTPENYRLASSQSDTSLGSPYQAAGSAVTSSTNTRDD